MLDLFSIFSKGGMVLWCFQTTGNLLTPSVNALISNVILQVRKYQKYLAETYFDCSIHRRFIKKSITFFLRKLIRAEMKRVSRSQSLKMPQISHISLPVFLELFFLRNFSTFFCSSSISDWT